MLMWPNKKSKLEKVVDKVVVAEKKVGEAREEARNYYFRQRSKFYKFISHFKAKCARIRSHMKTIYGWIRPKNNIFKRLWKKIKGVFKK